MTSRGKELQVSEKREVAVAEGEPTRAETMYVPQVDIFENGDALTLRADVPGARKEDIDIDLRDGVLTLTARVGSPPESWRPIYREHEVGGFARRFSVSERVAQEKISASVEHGVLTIVLPKADAHKPRSITVR